MDAVLTFRRMLNLVFRLNLLDLVFPTGVRARACARACVRARARALAPACVVCERGYAGVCMRVCVRRSRLRPLVVRRRHLVDPAKLFIYLSIERKKGRWMDGWMEN